MTTVIEEELVSNDNQDSVTTTTAPVLETTTNMHIVSLDKKEKKQKGRPVLHPFAGRVNLLREEVLLALENGDAFIEQMSKEHNVDEARYSELIAAGEISTEYDDIFYTFQGPIDIVLEEMQNATAKWNDNSNVILIRHDFKKKKIITDETSKLYVAPVKDDKVVKNIEVFPDRIYGYLQVRLKKD